MESAGSTLPADHTGNSGTDWAGIVTAGLAAVSLQRMSRKARQTALAIVFLLIFFGCPMACGLIMFVMDWFARLFGG